MGTAKQGRKENAEHKRYVEAPSLKQGSEMNGFRLKQGLPLSAPLRGVQTLNGYNPNSTFSSSNPYILSQ